DEATFSPLDISISSADMAMISTIAKRFNKDKALLAREALGQALQDMFGALDPVERKMLAKDADELGVSIAAEIAEEQGLDKLEVSGSNWVMQDKNCIKAERKAEKEKAKQQEMAASQVLADEPVAQMPASEDVIEDSMETEEDAMEQVETESADSADVETEDEVGSSQSIFA
ncbi:hypothetical protein A9Q73_09175, partial [Bermanella sp. 47_1433_sub80_T6]